MSFKKVVVAGGGVLGSQIAFQAAYCGFDVTIWLRSQGSIGRTQPKLDNLKKTYEEAIESMAAGTGSWCAGIADSDAPLDKAACLARIQAAYEGLKLELDMAAAVAGVDCDYRQVLVLHGGKNLLCQRAALCRSAHHPRVGQNHPHSNGHQRKREEEHPCARVPLPAAPHRTAGRLLFSVNCHLFFLTTLWRPRIRLAVCVLPCRMRFCLIFKATPHNSRLTA